LEVTREIYSKAADCAHVIIGNEEEFAVLTDTLPRYTTAAMNKQQTILLKRGHQGATLFHQQQRLDTGVYPVKPLKPYGAGDAFLGNLVYHYTQHQDWQKAIITGSAAAALVVSQRGCASVMPTPEQTCQLQDSSDMKPAAQWS
ncbi:MAG: PfkB family carbohydrate kinase, partial [Gammaproteobacteria bacterium]|nr:PfkB family carbohydrate kinase [Gammaproteobacteria bacterium]